MKKQFLLLIVAFMASITIAWGQDLTAPPADCAIARPIECLTGDALHPVPGIAYTYSVTVPNIAAGSGEFFWMVTQEKKFIENGVLTTTFETPGDITSHILSVDPLANYGTGVTAVGKDEIEIIWKSFVHDPDNPVFVVIQVRGTDANDCPVNNLKVYMIEPKHAFTLDIASLHFDGKVQPYGTPAESCFPDVVAAEWDAASGGVFYNFGVSYIYFTVTAANFNKEWRGSFQINGITAPQEITGAHWQYLETYAAGAWTAFSSYDQTSGTIELIEAQSSTGAVGAEGECIIIRLTITHNNFEGVDPQTISLAVDGETELSLPTPLKDLHHKSGDTECGSDDLFKYDIAEHILQPRPKIETNTQPTDTPKHEFLQNTGTVPGP